MKLSIFRGRIHTGFSHVGLITKWNYYIGDSICVHFGFNAETKRVSNDIEICTLKDMQLATINGILEIDKNPNIVPNTDTSRYGMGNIYNSIDTDTGFPMPEFFLYWHNKYPMYDLYSSNCAIFVSHFAISNKYDYVYNGKLYKL